jgi:hypothetical protein
MHLLRKPQGKLQGCVWAGHQHPTLQYGNDFCSKKVFYQTHKNDENNFCYLLKNSSFKTSFIQHKPKVHKSFALFDSFRQLILSSRYSFIDCLTT